MRCLIVDDSADFRGAARSMLERGGITVVASAGDGAEALRLCGELRPDLALVDVDLGGESGFDVAEQLRGAEVEHRPAVILISTFAEQDLAELIAASPAAGFVSKMALSADAIRDVLAGAGLSGPPGR
ncbi:response regulator [Mycobacterium sp. NPDC050551]|uniref:response regulator n=1 Tax=Mycobacterium sp. NPDC050551 TaxID=3155407 RepID=UPI003424F91C